MGSWLNWISDKVKAIPGALVDDVKTDVQNAANQAWFNIRNDVANATNQVGAAVTSSAAGAIAPGSSQPVTIPLSSGQLLAVAAGLALLIGYTVYALVKR